MTLSINFSKIFTALAVVLACVAPAAFVHAADLYGDSSGSYIDWSTPADYSSNYGDSTGSYIDWSTPADYSSNYGDSTGSYVDYTTPASYDYSGGGYSAGSYFGGYGGFGGSGFIGGGGFGGGSTFAPTTVSTYAPTTVSTYAPVSTCTAPNSCNSTVDDHSIFNAPTTVTVSGGGGGSYPVYQPVYQPVVYTPPPVYTPACSTCSCYGNCAPTLPIYPGPIARAPYVALSAVPYTGLDLGPIGTALYWTFLVLWCLGATYLVVVKRVQNKLVSNLNNFLFGSAALAVGGSTASSVHAAKVATHAAPAKAHTVTAVQEDGIDPFIAAQIAR